jgi:sugar phosphate isomerase/epimerase
VTAQRTPAGDGAVRLTCLESMLGDVDIGERFAMAQAAGFEGIDLRGDGVGDVAAEVRRLSDRTGLLVAAVYGRLGGPLLARTAAERAAMVELIRSRLRDAASVGAGRLIVVPVFGAARLAVADPEPAELTLLSILLGELVEEAAAERVEIVLEPLNRQETHLLRSPAVGAEIARGVGSPWVGTMLDTYHADREGLDVVAELSAAGDRLRLVHLSDRKRRLPGEGGIDFAAVLRALAALGYDGYLGFECRGTFDVDRLRRSVDWVREQQR